MTLNAPVERKSRPRFKARDVAVFLRPEILPDSDVWKLGNIPANTRPLNAGGVLQEDACSPLLIAGRRCEVDLLDEARLRRLAHIPAGNRLRRMIVHRLQIFECAEDSCIFLKNWIAVIR